MDAVCLRVAQRLMEIQMEELDRHRHALLKKVEVAQPVQPAEGLASVFQPARIAAVPHVVQAIHLFKAHSAFNAGIQRRNAGFRRAAAVALEQEMKARVQEMQAKVVEAQAQVPLAMAEAFRSGRLGVMDYYRMENVQADTTMRKSIASPDDKK